jgi:hypothetical protein
MNRKEKLINSLNIAIKSLQNDTVLYDWQKQSSCNAGIVAQAVLDITPEELTEIRKPFFNVIPNDTEGTWKNAIKYGCSVTGKSMFEIITKLSEAGLTKEDIVHLEYLENPAILEKSGIEKETICLDVKVREETIETVVPHSNFFKRMQGKTETSVTVKPIYEKQILETKYPDGYYSKKENLIKYLSAWVTILKEEPEMKTESTNLEAQLLNAVANEDYELACKIRDNIRTLEYA